MKMLNSIRKNSDEFGFIRTHDNDPCYPFNNQHLKITLTFTLGIISILLFGIEVAESPKEHMDSFLVEILTISIFISYTTTMIFQTSKLFAFFDSFEEVKNDCK